MVSLNPAYQSNIKSLMQHKNILFGFFTIMFCFQHAKALVYELIAEKEMQVNSLLKRTFFLGSNII